MVRPDEADPKIGDVLPRGNYSLRNFAGTASAISYHCRVEHPTLDEGSVD
jgi:hypothetical protein